MTQPELSRDQSTGVARSIFASSESRPLIGSSAETIICFLSLLSSAMTQVLDMALGQEMTTGRDACRISSGAPPEKGKRITGKGTTKRSPEVGCCHGQINTMSHF